MYISPSNRWLPSDNLKPRDTDSDLPLRAIYDEVVAGLPLFMATERAAIWHDHVISACGLPPYVEPDDLTVL